MGLGDLDAYLDARRRERAVRAQLAAGELYEWVGDSDPTEEEASAAATWLGDHIGHRVERRIEDVARTGTLWLIETEESLGRLVGWRIRVGPEAWPLTVNACCLRWTRTYRAGDPPQSWGRAVLNVAQTGRGRPGWASHYQVEDCAQDPAWLPPGARLHYG